MPWKTIRPPSWPAPGPRSMIQSACAMTAWWCSMTMTDLPDSTSRSSRPSSCSTSARCRPMDAGAAHLQHPCRCPHRRLQAGPVVQVPPGNRAAGPQPVDGALEDHLATGRASAWAEVDDVVGDRDRLRLVLHDEYRVALVAQLPQQVVHPLDVVGVQADGGLVEDVSDVGE